MDFLKSQRLKFGGTWMHTSDPVLSLDVVSNGREMSTMLNLTRADGLREDSCTTSQ